ncbi:MAG: hypothetical protein A2731_02310 [Candidatus Buchananbacteria bacterium RIFCSPHIGHO2_01_FULL_39_8]|uniref:Uncharacterized protein n=1 Tax=Candidatus Buchananbacteria bacterium RIFCSPHIGHO2_01_FULL_39_8 TaxID=1797533 RepID=A0A1G1XX53_9BACT|nr:MAG: hypothetical protein A2731_02310 [Candidatus Buchananbacteria bacterium RIFCSPHIGHO2_01_FULL_39_8]
MKPPIKLYKNDCFAKILKWSFLYLGLPFFYPVVLTRFNLCFILTLEFRMVVNGSQRLPFFGSKNQELRIKNFIPY